LPSVLDQVLQRGQVLKQVELLEHHADPSLGPRLRQFANRSEPAAGHPLVPVFALLENRYHTPLVEAEYQLEAAAADPVVAQALQVPARSPIFLIERTSYTTGNRPIDYERLHYRGDLIRFVTRLVRHARASMQR